MTLSISRATQQMENVEEIVEENVEEISKSHI